jgi:hypothetical protein
VIVRTPLVVKSMYSAFWVTGRMEVSTTRSAMAVTAYTVRADEVQPYGQTDQAAADGKPP